MPKKPMWKFNKIYGKPFWQKKYGTLIQVKRTGDSKEYPKTIVYRLKDWFK